MQECASDPLNINGMLPRRTVEQALSAKDKFAGLPAACAAALRCMPFVVPTQWLTSPAQMAEELAAYTIHLEGSVRKVRACSQGQGN